MTEESRDRATFEAFDGVELRFLGGVVRKCAALTVAEAAHYLRLEARVNEGDLAAMRQFAAEFPDRIGMLDVRLTDTGLEVVGPGGAPLSFGDLTVADGLELSEIVAEAVGRDRRAPKAQVRILDEFPATFGLDARTLTPADVFEVARAFTEALYLHIYGLAKDFYGHLSRSPRVEVMTMTRAPAGSSFSMQASTT